MARVKGELKNMSGTVGNIVFCQRKGITYARTKPSKYHDAKTDKQLVARGRFRGCNIFYKLLRDDMLRHVWRMVAEETGSNPKNMFIKHNFYAFDAYGCVKDYGRLQFSAGLLPMSDGLYIGRHNDHDCTVEWEYDRHENVGLPTDRLYIVEFHESKRPEIHDLNAVRSEGKAAFSTLDKIGHEIHLYCFWGNRSATAFSPTYYFREIPLLES